MKPLIYFLDKSWPLFLILLFVLAVFRDFFIKGLLPIPMDILVGTYFPWLDSKWGYIVGVSLHNPLPSDIISIIYPWRILGMEMIKNGILPLWDSNSLLGLPLLANFQAALLNPLNLLFFLLPSSYAWSIQVILQPVLISIFTYIFLRNIKLNKPAALFGALSFAYCGFSVVWLEYNTIGFTLAFFPLILFFIDKILQTRKILFIFLLGLSVALQIFSGYPQVSIISLLFAALYLLYKLVLEGKYLFTKVMYCVIGFVTGILLAAVQLLPGIEALNLSIRSYDSTALAGGIQFLPIQHFVTLFVPDFFGNPATGNYWSVGSYDNFAFSLPAVTLFFAVMAVISRSSFTKANSIFYFLIILSFILSTNNPISNYLIIDQNILGLRSSVAVRILFVFDFAVIVLAARQLDEVLNRRKFKLVPGIIPLLVFIIVLGIILLVTKSTYQQIALRNFILPFTITIATFLSCTFLLRWSVRYFLGAVYLLLLFGVLVVTGKYLTFTPLKIFYPPMDAITILQDNIKYHRFDKERGEILPSNTWYPYALKAASGQNPLVPLSTAKYMGIIKKEKPGQYSRYIDLSDPNSLLYDTLDIKYIAVLNRNVPLAYPDEKGEPFGKFLTPKLKEFKNINTVRIMENTTNLGLAWFAQSSRCGFSENEVFDELTKISYDPKKLMLINCLSSESLSFKNGDNIIGVVDVIRESPLLTQLKVVTPEANFLNISKAFYPGWKAFVDGKEVSLYSANIALTALLVPAGEHLVELKYQPVSFFFGLKISLATLGMWVLVLVGKLTFSTRTIIRKSIN
ncbi:MAG: YfhO family protein [Candidatus Daviesbacteria bacterium]|nr:YfhO family protein [Candidatus Daviesbacteria bacterium]